MAEVLMHLAASAVKPIRYLAVESAVEPPRLLADTSSVKPTSLLAPL